MDDPEEENYVLVCAPESWDHVDGSSLVDADCGHAVWIAPSGRAALNKRKMTIKCVPCCPDAWDDPSKLRTNPDSFKEIESHLGAQQADALQRILRAMGVRDDDT